MAYLCIIVNDENGSIQNLNDLAQTPTKVHEELNLLMNYIRLIQNGRPASLYVVSRDTDPVVATSGAGSEKVTYSKL